MVYKNYKNMRTWDDRWMVEDDEIAFVIRKGVPILGRKLRVKNDCGYYDHT